MVPTRDRFRLWNVLLNKWLLGTQGRALADAPFQVSARLRVLPEMRFGWGALGPSHYSRTPDVVAQDNDDLFLFMNLAGPFTAMHDGSEIELAPGDAYVMPCSERGSHVRPRGGRQLCLRVRRDAIQPLVRRLDDRLSSVIPRDTEALRTLSTYLRVAMSQPLADDALRAVAVRHVHDLMALALGATRDQRHVLETRGLSAARLRAARVLVRRHLADTNLSPEFIAGRLGIALDSGFGDISYFNRAFRALYHASPSEIRRSVLAPPEFTA